MKHTLRKTLLTGSLLAASVLPSLSTISTVNAQDAIPVSILAQSASEQDVNIIRDQLTKAGFQVETNIQPDYASFQSQKDAGNYDLAISSWTTVTGNPDYAVRSLFISNGDNSIQNDPKLDELINQAASQTTEEYIDTYQQFEEWLVNENAYIIPLYSSLKAQAFNHELLNPDSIRLSKSRAFAWEPVSYIDDSQSESRPLVLTQTSSQLTSLDPIKANDGSINQLNTNMYVRLINLTDDDQITSENSLSYNHVIGEGNSDYYFILRDDINFAKIEDQTAVDTGDLVSAEDVIFSLNRAKDPNSVPDNRTYSLHEHIAEVSVVEDITELEETTVSGSDQTVREALEEGLDQEITNLVVSEDEVNNANGNYQVVKLTTTEPFPQVLNYLGHQSAGIVSEKQVQAINTYDIENYDVNSDIAYGDQRAITEGDTYDNHLWASGPYILVDKNDYQANFVKNPAYRPDTEADANISQVTVRFIADSASALSALRAGEIDLMYGLGEVDYPIVENEASLTLQSIPSNGVTYMLFNVNTPGRPVTESANLRKAILYAVNQEEINAAYQGLKLPTFSTLSPLVDTGNTLVADPARVEEFKALYLEEAN
ncbi:ABC transporter substrate-binding protein [Aerococcaceae bacterium WGS1372]